MGISENMEYGSPESSLESPLTETAGMKNVHGYGT